MSKWLELFTKTNVCDQNNYKQSGRPAHFLQAACVRNENIPMLNMIQNNETNTIEKLQKNINKWINSN